MIRYKARALLYIGGNDCCRLRLQKMKKQNCWKNMQRQSGSQKHPNRKKSQAGRLHFQKFENAGVNVEDLISIGTIGLIKAVNTFKPEKNIKLATYASRMH